MTHAPRITDESVLSRWLGMEITAINRGVVKERKSLSVLLGETAPQSITKMGGPYVFRKGVLAKIAEKIPNNLHKNLMLPIFFYCSADVPDSCSCPDAVAFEVFRILGEISSMRTMEKGKFWVSRAIVYDIARKYPTVIQIVMAP